MQIKWLQTVFTLLGGWDFLAWGAQSNTTHTHTHASGAIVSLHRTGPWPDPQLLLSKPRMTLYEVVHRHIPSCYWVRQGCWCLMCLIPEILSSWKYLCDASVHIHRWFSLHASGHACLQMCSSHKATKLKQETFHLPFRFGSHQSLHQFCLLTWTSLIFVIFSAVIIMICHLKKKKLLMSVCSKKKIK